VFSGNIFVLVDHTFEAQADACASQGLMGIFLQP